MSNDSNSDSDQDPTPPAEQIAEAFALSAMEVTEDDFGWLIRYLDAQTDSSVRLVQFAVYGRGRGVSMVLHVQASQLGELVQTFEDNVFRIPYEIRVLARYYGSPGSVDVYISWIGGGGH